MEDRGKKFELTEAQEKALKLKVTDLPGIIEYAHSVGGFAIVPTEQGVIKAQAVQAMQEQTSSQLQMLYEQMKLLAQQAKEIQDRVNFSQQIYQAEIRFQPVVGQSYFLYRHQEQGHCFLSMISPEEWKRPSGQTPIALAKATLLADHTWKVIQKYEDPENR